MFKIIISTYEGTGTLRRLKCQPMKEIIKFLVRLVPFLQSYPHWVQGTFFAWLFLTLGVAAILFFTPRLSQPSAQSPITPNQPTPLTNPSPVLYDAAQATSLIDVLNERKERIQIDLDRVIGKLVSMHKDDAANQLKDLRARFLVLQARHVTAIRTNDAIMSHELDGEIYDVLYTIRSIVNTTVDTTTQQWFANLGIAYLRAPERDEDPKYAAVQDDVLRLRKETSDLTDVMLYPGEPPTSISKPLSDLAFAPPPKTPQQPSK